MVVRNVSLHNVPQAQSILFYPINLQQELSYVFRCVSTFANQRNCCENHKHHTTHTTTLSNGDNRMMFSIPHNLSRPSLITEANPSFYFDPRMSHLRLAPWHKSAVSAHFLGFLWRSSKGCCHHCHSYNNGCGMPLGGWI